MDAKLKSHFINIYCMILADGKVDQEEINSMYRIGREYYGVQPEELNQLIICGDVVFYKPEDATKRILYLYDLAQVATSDGVVTAAERMLLEKYAQKFDVEEEQVSPLINKLIECAEKGLSQKELLELFA